MNGFHEFSPRDGFACGGLLAVLSHHPGKYLAADVSPMIGDDDV
ncbi:hypothetical protein [Halothiobacillus sp.]|nr:hypothetical protein [Halothiobacillus sp.]